MFKPVVSHPVNLINYKKVPMSRRKKYGLDSDGATVFVCVILGLILALIIRRTLLGSFYLCLTSDALMREDEEAFRIIGADRNKFENNSDKNLVFIGVMTAQAFIDTRTPAVYNTWARRIAGKVAVFAREDAVTTSDQDIPIIRLAGTDDAYPPQKKAFMLLKYMYDHYLNHFEYFIRTDDDVYIRPERLEKFLRSVNSSKLQYIGQMGKGNAAEFGALSLLDNENYCMGGPGMILSRSTLARIGPHIRECLTTMHTDHEDVEVGRCVQKFTGIPCTWSYEMKNIVINMQKPLDVLDGDLKKFDLHLPISIHPIKNPIHMYRFHNYVQETETRTYESEIKTLMRELGTIQSSQDIPIPMMDEPSNGWFVSHLADEGTFHPGRAVHEGGVMQFSLIDNQEYSSLTGNPHHHLFFGMNESVYEIVKFAMNDYYDASIVLGREMLFRAMIHSYYRPNPGVGLQFMTDMSLFNRVFVGRKRTIPVKRRINAQVPYGPLHVKEHIVEKQPSAVQDIDEPTDTVVHFLLPLSGRFEIFVRFMKNYEQVILQNTEAATLTIAHYNASESGEFEMEGPHNIIKKLQYSYPGTVMDIVEGEGKFARGPALQLAADQWMPSSLLFFLDVDLMFNRDMLNRIRLHTRRGKQVYYPAFFSEFDPGVSGFPPKDDTGHTMVTEESGYFRTFAFGQVSVYKSDLDSVGGFNTSIKGWGMEDTDLYEKFVSSTTLDVFRTAEAGLAHIYHPPACFNTYKADGDTTIQETQRTMCLNSIYSTHCSARKLARRVVLDPMILYPKPNLTLISNQVMGQNPVLGVNPALGEGNPVVAGNPGVAVNPVVAPTPYVAVKPDLAANPVVTANPIAPVNPVLAPNPDARANPIVEAQNPIVPENPVVPANRASPVVQSIPAVAGNPVVQSIPAVAGNPVAASDPVVAPNPIVAPKPVVAANPAAAPKSIVAANPVVASNPIVVAKPAAVANPVEAPKPVIPVNPPAPNPVIAPIPIVASNPVVAPNPDIAPKPVAAANPAAVPKPIVAANPAAVPKPIVAANPAAVPKPIVAANPAIPPKPVVAAMPAVAGNPAIAPKPVPAANPVKIIKST